MSSISKREGTMDDQRALPIAAIARLLNSGKSSVDIEAELLILLEEGRRQITIGIGPMVDIPLLDHELFAAEVSEVDREIVVASVRAESEGYVVERGFTNFGLYVWSDLEPVWQSVPWRGSVSRLRPGDKVAMGSTPADALKFVLPESSAVPPRMHHRSARQDAAVEQRHRRDRDGPEGDLERATHGGLRAATPVSGGRRTPGGAWQTPMTASSRPAPLRVDSDRYQRAFDVAIKHWRYAMITIGGDDRSVVQLDDPDLADLRAAIGRNLDQPDRGYELFVKDPKPELWVQPTGSGAHLLKRGDVIRLRGSGNRLGFCGYVVHLPPPAGPVPRFGPREVPDRVDIARVLGLDEHDLDQPELVKSAHRDLVRRFHPDRHDGDPGHLSRFLEIQACFDAWKKSV